MSVVAIRKGNNVYLTEDIAEIVSSGIIPVFNQKVKNPSILLSGSSFVLVKDRLHHDSELISTRYGNVFRTVNYKCSGTKEVYDLDDLQLAVEVAIKTKSTLRAVGSLHSSTDIIQTDGILLDTRHLDKVLSLTSNSVHVEGGCNLQILVDHLAKSKLKLLNQGHILRQTIAGVLSTATHGTGRTSTLSDSIKSIQIVDGRGRLIKLTRGDGIMFQACCVGLGCMGLIYSVELDVYPLNYLSVSTTKAPDVFEVLRNCAQRKEQYPHYEFFISTWLKPICVEYIYQDVNPDVLDNKMAPLGDFYSALDWLNDDGLDQLIKDLNQDRHFIDWLSYYRIRFASQRFNKVDPAHQALSRESGLFPYIEMEYNIPLKFAYQAGVDILDMCKDVGMQIMYRFVNGDKQGIVSPAYQRDSIYISFETPNLNLDNKVIGLLKKLEILLLDRYEGRPHWGKFYFNNKKIREKRRKELVLFGDVQSEIDPWKIFHNRWTHDFL